MSDRDLEADDGTRIGRYTNAWTRKSLLVADDGRVFRYGEKGIAEHDAPENAVRAALPSRRDWLELGGYGPGGLLDEDDNAPGRRGPPDVG